MDLTEEQVIYKQGYWDGVADFAEFMTKRDYPNAIEEAVEIHVDALIKLYKEYCDNESREDD